MTRLKFATTCSALLLGLSLSSPGLWAAWNILSEFAQETQDEDLYQMIQKVGDALEARLKED